MKQALSFSLLVLFALITSVTAVQARESVDFAERASDSLSEDMEVGVDYGPPTIEAEWYAKAFDLTFEEAMKRVLRMDDLEDLLAPVAEHERGRLAGWGLIHEPELMGWIYLKGDEAPSKGALDLLSKVEDVRIEVGASHTQAELEELASRVVMRGSKFGDAISSSGVDLRSNQVVIGLAPMGQRETEAGLRASSAAIEEHYNSLAARSESTPSRRSTPVYRAREIARTVTNSIQPMEAGQALEVHHFEGGLAGYCTTGFSVQRHGTRGFLTAAHCRDWTSYVLKRHWDSRTVSGATAGASWWRDVTVMRNTVQDNSGDFMWFSLASNAQVTDNFWSTPNQLKDLLKVTPKSNMYGHLVCMYGARSAVTSCGIVDDTSFDPNFSFCGGPFSCDNVYVKATAEGNQVMEACGQDSGAPTFRYRRGYGIHNGSDNGDCNGSSTFMVFSALDYIEGELDVTVNLS